MKKQKRIILVTGATGHQGGEVARHLPQRGFQVRAFVHHPKDPEAKKLAEIGAEVMDGDFDDKSSLDRAMKDVYGVFSVQDAASAGPEKEAEQGRAVIDAARSANVEHFVYSSVGSANRNTGVPHFDSKWKVEEHLRSIGMKHTILRPVFFYYNYNGDQFHEMIRNGFLALPLRPDKHLQQLSEEDYAEMVATVFEQPDNYLDRALDVASSEPDMLEVVKIFSRVTGKPVEYRQISWEEFENQTGPEITKMYRWFEEVGYDANLAELRKEFGELTGLEQYLKSHNWTRADARTASFRK